MSSSASPPAAFAASRPTTRPLCVRSTWGSREGLPLLASFGVGLALLASARWGTLPAAGPTLVFLLPAVWWDVRELRIPNALTFPALAAVWLWSAIHGGASGIAEALAASACALALGFGPFAWGWLGAGDVKALMVLAALWGLEAFFPAVWWMLVVGGVGALLVLTARGGLIDLLRRWGRSIWLTLVRRRVYYVSAPPDSAARQGLPFALAMGLGCAACAVFGSPV